MENILERYFRKLLMYHGTEKGFEELVREVIKVSRDFGMNSMVKFFAHQNFKTNERRKRKLKNDFDNMFMCIGDLAASNAGYFKKVDAKYRYWYKHVKRR
jgi:hypothetical protein